MTVNNPDSCAGQLADPAGTDLVALHDALSSATLAAFIAEGGDDPECVREAVTEGAVAAAEAFPDGGPAYEAFRVVLNAITDAMAVPA